MRGLHHYSGQEWLQGHPLRDAFKQIRNDILLSHYVKSGEGITQQQQTINTDSPLVISIAFNKPDIINLLIENFRRNVPAATLLIADNSTNTEQRHRIKTICQQQQILYLPLPPNKTRHPNRSHGMAMQWCYELLTNTLMRMNTDWRLTRCLKKKLME